MIFDICSFDGKYFDGAPVLNVAADQGPLVCIQKLHKRNWPFISKIRIDYFVKKCILDKREYTQMDSVYLSIL